MVALAGSMRCGNTARVTEPADCQQRPGAHYRRNALLALSMALLAACGGGQALRPAAPAAQAWPAVAPADPARANAVLMRAISLVGVPGDEVSYLNKRLTINGQPMAQTPVSDFFDESVMEYFKQFDEQLGARSHRVIVDTRRAGEPGGLRAAREGRRGRAHLRTREQ